MIQYPKQYRRNRLHIHSFMMRNIPINWFELHRYASSRNPSMQATQILGCQTRRHRKILRKPFHEIQPPSPPYHVHHYTEKSLVSRPNPSSAFVPNHRPKRRRNSAFQIPGEKNSHHPGFHRRSPHLPAMRVRSIGYAEDSASCPTFGVHLESI